MRGLAFAAAAAVIASVGDVMMLYVAMGNLPLVSGGGRTVLYLGGWLGVLAIPTYYLGYRECAGLMARWSEKGRASTTALGALVACFGAATHGLTALDIHEALAAGSRTRLPEEAFAPGFSPLFICGVVAVIATVLAAIVFIRGTWPSSSRSSTTAAILNPITGTLLLSAPGLVSAQLAAYLTPAAPNLAHALFFAACARAIHVGRKR